MKRDLFYIESSRGTERVFYQPYGWSQAGYEIVRNETYQGLWRKFVVSSLKFVKDGKAILKALKESEGTECIAYFIVKRFDPSTHFYTQCYKGKINFSTYQRSTDSCTVNIEDSGFEISLKNREDIPVILSKLVDMDGGVITPFTVEGNEVTFPERQDYFRDNFINESVEVFTDSHCFPLKLDTSELSDSHTVIDPLFTASVDGSIFLASETRVMVITGTLSETVHFEDSTPNESQVSFQIRRYSGTGLMQSIEVMAGTSEGGDTLFTSPPINETITINSGEWINIISIITPYAGGVYTVPPSDCHLLITTFGQVAPSYTAQSYFYEEAFTRIIQSCTGVANAFYSDTFKRTDSETPSVTDGLNSLGVVLNGKQIRGIDVPMSVSFKELFTGLKSVMNLGMGVESGQVRIEPLEYFYQRFIIQDVLHNQLTFGDCKDIVESAHPDMIWNKINIGFEKAESTQSTSGLWEYNTKITYANFIKSIKRELSLVSGIRADDAGIMLARANYKLNDPDKDISTDEDNFMLKVQRNGIGHPVKAEENENFTLISGTVNNAQVYNVEYSPARSIRRFGSLIRSFLALYPTTSLIYTKQDKNSRLVSQKSGEDMVTESADILVSDLEAPFYEPSKYTFETPITQTQLDIIQLGTTSGAPNSYGVVKFRENDYDLIWKYGWILSIRVKSNDIQTTANFELLKVDPTLALTLEPS